MRPSKYNITTENNETSELIVFNSMYGGMATISPKGKQQAYSILAGGVGASAMVESFVKLRFLVENDLDEVALLRSRKCSGIKDLNRLEVVVMPNMACNFACPYCYEKHDPRARMDRSVKGNVVRWLEGLIPGHKVMQLQWFGGEPLISAEVVLELTEFVRNVCEAHKVVLLSNITTNGYLLNNELIGRLLNVGIRNYQITVDGPPEVHNKTRVLRSGGGSFDRIFSNIHDLARADSKVRVSIRVNYNHRNINSISGLLGLFSADIRAQLRVVFEPIFGSEEHSATSNLAPAVISRTINRCYEEAESLGYCVQHRELGVGRLVYCYAERENQFIVDFKGDVFKCSVGDFQTESRFGRIGEGGRLIRDNDQWDRWYGLREFEERCEECVFLPLCMGGCRKNRIANRTTGSYCHLVPTNTSQVLKSVAFGTFVEIMLREDKTARACANGLQPARGCNSCNALQNE